MRAHTETSEEKLRHRLSPEMVRANTTTLYYACVRHTSARARQRPAARSPRLGLGAASADAVAAGPRGRASRRRVYMSIVAGFVAGIFGLTYAVKAK